MISFQSYYFKIYLSLDKNWQKGTFTDRILLLTQKTITLKWKRLSILNKSHIASVNKT